MFDATEPGNAPVAAGELAETCVTAALDALGVAAALPLDAVDGSALRQMAVQLERARRVLDATQLHTLAALDERGLTEVATGHRVSTWLAHAAKIPAGTARARLALANRLATDPTVAAVADALRAGRINAEHARTLVEAVNPRNAEVLVPALGDLIEASRAMVFTRWRQHVEHLAALTDPDGAHDPAGDLAANRLTLSPSDRFVLVRGELAGEHAVCVTDTLNALADELYLQYARDAAASDGAIGIPPRSTLLALALEEACRRALATDASSSTPPRTEATLTLHADLEPTGSLDIWAIHHQVLGPLPATTVPTLLCDATFAAVVLGRLGVPTDLGHTHRHPSPAQRRALLVRDGGCAFPGCDAHPRWLDVHHVRPWSLGGTTDLSNLACRQYVRLLDSSASGRQS